MLLKNVYCTVDIINLHSSCYLMNRLLSEFVFSEILPFHAPSLINSSSHLIIKQFIVYIMSFQLRCAEIMFKHAIKISLPVILNQLSIIEFTSVGQNFIHPLLLFSTVSWIKHADPRIYTNFLTSSSALTIPKSQSQDNPHDIHPRFYVST